MKNHTAFTALDYKHQAKRKLPKFVFDFIDGGSGNEDSLTRNSLAFNNIHLLPSIKNTKEAFVFHTEILGLDYAAPFGIAPLGLCGLVDPNAELILAKAAAKYRIPYTISSATNISLERIVKASGVAPWFQLYIPRLDSQLDVLLQLAENQSCPVLVVTTDTPVPGRRLRDLRNGLKIPYQLSYANVVESLLSPRWTAKRLLAGKLNFPNYSNLLDVNPKMRFSELMSLQTGGALDWDRLQEIRDKWPRKLVFKGIVSTQDAHKAKNIGADAIIISNHGGRQLNSSPAPITVLPSLLNEGLDTDFLFLDSGIRSGEDIVKSLSIGAGFTFVGRLFLYALAAGGEQAIDRLINILIEECTLDLKLIGANSPKDAKGKSKHIYQ